MGAISFYNRVPGLKKLTLGVAFGFLIHPVLAQKSGATAPLFQDQKVLDLKLKVSIKDIKKKTNDSTYLPAQLLVKNQDGAWDSISIEVRARGIFRLAHCYWPPIRVKVGKGARKGTVFEGNKSLKLVMPCQNNDGKNALVMKEFMCYKIGEVLTPYYFQTRLVNLDFTEDDGKKVKNWQLTAFLIEDDDIVAKRHHAKVMEKLNLHPLGLHDSSALRHDLFQMLVANTDWSTTFLHNTKVIFQPPRKYIPLAYDFDMSGFVNPPYAEVNADLGIANVRERLYRGFCRDEAVVQAIRREYIAKEGAVMQVMAQFEKDLPPRDYNDVRRYVGEFFTLIKDDRNFKRFVIDQCRKR